MNIFVLDTDVKRCAQYHVDKHVTKLLLESTQLLNNALITNDNSYIPVYRPTHLKHPASLWTAESLQNFEWLNDLALALCDEYTYRYGKTHKCQSILERFNVSLSKNKMSNVGMTPFVKCMPDQYKVNDVVESYRNYYRGDKAYIAKWTKRDKPEWWIK